MFGLSYEGSNTHTHTHSSLDSVLQQLSRPLLHDSSLVTQLLTHPDELTGGETERKTGGNSKKRGHDLCTKTTFIMCSFFGVGPLKSAETHGDKEQHQFYRRRETLSQKAEYKQT